MGQIKFNDTTFPYDEARHKSLGELLFEQGLFFADSKGSDGSTGEECKVFVLYGNAIFDGMVRSLSQEKVPAYRYIPIGNIEIKSIEAEDDIPVSGEIYGAQDIGLAIDLGAGSAVFYFYHLLEGSIITIQSADNHVQGLVLIDQLIERMVKSTAMTYCFDVFQIKRIVIAENFGMRAAATSIEGTDHLPTYFFPPLSERVDGNITASAYYCGLDKPSLSKLFIDLGTRGELCLSYNGKLYCATADNVQVFGGIGISCGMGGQTGGIFGASVYSSGKVHFATVDDTIPIGICGTGMIDLTLMLRKLGKIDESGKLLDGDEYVFVEEDEESPQIYLTQEDICLIIEAKARLCAAIDLLFEAVGISLSDLDEVIFGGDVGMKINFTNISAFGIIPPQLVQKCKWEGNTRGLGGVKLLCRFGDVERIEAFARSSIYIDVLASDGFERAVTLHKKV